MNPYALYLAVQFASSVLFNTTSVTAILYLVDDASLNPLQVVLVGTVLEAAYFVLNLPTGLLADSVSRRKCVIVGFLVLGVGFVVQGLFPVFAWIVAAQVVSALGYALVDGALEAWIIGETRQEHVTRVLLRGSQAAQVGTLVGAVASGLLASVAHNLTFLVCGALLAVLGLALMPTMGEAGFRPTVRARPAVGARAAFGEVAGAAATAAAGVSRVVRGRPVLLTMFVVMALYGAASEGFDRLSPAHLVEDLTFPTWAGLDQAGWLSALAVMATLAGLLVTELARVASRAERATTVASVFGTVTVGLVLSIGVFANVTGFYVAVVAYWLAKALRTSYSPLVTAWVAGQAPDELRASVLSAGQVCDSVGQVAGGPLIGAVGTAASLRAALTASGAMLLPALLLLAGLRRRLADTARAAGTAGSTVRKVEPPAPEVAFEPPGTPSHPVGE